VVPFGSLGKRVHAHGAAVFCQITHLGRRARWDSHNWLPLIAPSATREPAHRSYAKEMEDWDFRRVIKAFADAAGRCKAAGLDGVEIIAAAHHLMDSFLSPITNQRTDAYGAAWRTGPASGSRSSPPCASAWGTISSSACAWLATELIQTGLDAGECLKIAAIFANSGLIDYISVYQSQGDNFVNLSAMLPDMSYPPAAFLYLASAIKAEVDIPILHASAIATWPPRTVQWPKGMSISSP
jgi:2,4-dienoyl-CoA reductase-like NADH-dependent reductase (Old Yellow Enzyme family)